MKNQFAAQKYVEEAILDEDERRIGLIRIKPSSVLWKPRSEHKFYCVSLDEFVDWITSASTAARRTRQ